MDNKSNDICDNFRNSANNSNLMKSIECYI